ncbi:MAG: hypothetical protein M1819_007405 [Sarea resinae]|nr:MAG: hypothetical protein M1819_007405 [Sarea resinae]
MVSPTQSGRSSPRRRALHERSESQNNEILTSTIRLIEDLDARVYSSSPFPTQPSQILPPHNDGLGIRIFEDEGNSKGYITPADSPKPKSNASSPAQGVTRKARQGQKHTTSPEAASPGTGPAPSRAADLSKVSAALSSYSTIRKVDDDSRKSDETVKSTDPESYAIIQLPSESEARSTDPSPPKSLDGNSDAPAAPRRSASKRSSSTTAVPLKPILKSSAESLRGSNGSRASTAHRSISVPIAPSATVLQAAIESGANVQYPMVRPPSAVGSWAETSIAVPKRTRTNESSFAQRQRYSDLSTVFSEPERSSKAFTERSSGIPASSATSAPSRSGRSGQATRGAARSTIRIVNESDDSVPDLQPTKSLRSLRSRVSGFLSNSSASSRRGSKSDEQSQRTNSFTDNIPSWARYFHRRSHAEHLATVEENSSTNATKRTFYRHNEPGSVPGTADSADRSGSPTSGDFPYHIFRPRNRPHQHQAPIRGSLDIEAAPQEDVLITGPPRPRQISESWAPRLQQDKRASDRNSVWQPPPQIPAKAETGVLSKRNLQVLLFCLGFVFPFGESYEPQKSYGIRMLIFDKAWMIGAFLPLPMPATTAAMPTDTPTLSSTPALTPKSKINEKGKSNAEGPGNAKGKGPDPSTRDVEKAIPRTAEATAEEARYQNARWWRNLNRIMSCVGVLVIGAVVSSFDSYLMSAK